MYPSPVVLTWVISPTTLSRSSIVMSILFFILSDSISLLKKMMKNLLSSSLGFSHPTISLWSSSGIVAKWASALLFSFIWVTHLFATGMNFSSAYINGTLSLTLRLISSAHCFAFSFSDFNTETTSLSSFCLMSSNPEFLMMKTRGKNRYAIAARGG